MMDKTLQWGLVDFLGRYHKHAIASDFPVPGSAVSRDEGARRSIKLTSMVFETGSTIYKRGRARACRRRCGTRLLH